MQVIVGRNDMYKCDKCGWTGTDNEVFHWAGYLWDYETYDCCPVCWELEEELSFLTWLSETE
jgi:hypothetical protein